LWSKYKQNWKPLKRETYRLTMKGKKENQSQFASKPRNVQGKKNETGVSISEQIIRNELLYK